MTDPDTISADYTLRPSELAEALSLLARSQQPVIVWGPPGCGKSQIAQQVASQDGYNYIDVRALMLDPVDLRGIPWRDGNDRTRWAPPSFLPPTTSTALYLTVDRIVPEMRDLERAQDGNEVKAWELQTLSRCRILNEAPRMKVATTRT